MNKAYARINWENYPSDSTPINERNLNKIDAAVNEIDNRVVAQDATKLDKTTAATMVKDVTYDESTGIFTVTYLNGATIILDTKMEKLAVNFDYDKENQQLIISLDDGTKQYVDLSALITEYEFADTDTIAFTIDSAGKVSAIVKDGSITEDKLQPNFLADVKVEVAKAQASASESSVYSKISKSYAIGTDGEVRENDNADNAKYYYEQAKQISQGLNGIIPMGTVAFADLPTSGMNYGWMYNISDDFTSDERFNDGGGIYYGAGNNVIWMSDDKWDVTASSGVTGVKGDKETAYRQGNVNITPKNIGALSEDGDTNNNSVTFTTADSISSAEWTDVEQMKSGEKHSSLFNKISTMFKNMRYLYKMLGSTDISAIGDGTTTGAIASQNETLTQLNTNLNKRLVSYTNGDKPNNQLTVREYAGTACSGAMFVQADLNNNCINIGIDGKGTIGVNYAQNANIANVATSANIINDGICSFTPTQIRDRMGVAVKYIGLYEQEITLAGGGTFFQEIPAQYQNLGNFYMINCSNNSLNFLCNMESYTMAVRNISSETLATVVQVYCFCRSIY